MQLLDKELLMLLLRNLSEIEIINLYKNKKINNYGFRANTLDDIKKNRGILENNLLKPLNYKIVQKNVLDFNVDIDIEDVSDENFQDFIDEHGLLKLSSVLCIHNKTDLLETILKKLNNPSEKNSDLTKIILDTNIKDESENKLQKIIKKLEIKIINLTEEFGKKEQYFKSQFEEKNIELNNLRTEKNALKIDLNASMKQIQYLTNVNKKIMSENEKLKDDIDKLTNQLTDKSIEIETLRIELEEVKKIMNENETSNSYIQNKYTHAEDQSNKSLLPNIAVIGEYSRMISEQLPIYNFSFFEMKNINELKNSLKNYDYLWIIHYDLTQKEQKIINNILIKDLKDINTETILTLKDLNNVLATFKQKDGI